MRKILIGILTLILFFVTIYFMVSGYKMFNITGFMGIDEKSKQVDSKIVELQNVITKNFSDAESAEKKSSIELTNSKTEYETQATLAQNASSSYISQLETYDIDYLWTKIGNYAKKENVIIKIDVTSGGASSNLYNLNFAVNGDYINITDFIYDIENDSKLGFKIDDFKMIDSNEDILLATFVCADIPIKLGKIESSSSSRNSTQNNNSAQNSNDSNTNDNQQTNSNTTNNNTTQSNNSNSTQNTNTSGTANSNGTQTQNSTGSTSSPSSVQEMTNGMDPNKSNLTNDQYSINNLSNTTKQN